MALLLKIADLSSTPTQLRAALPMNWCAERLGDAFVAQEAVAHVVVSATRTADVVEIHGEISAGFAFPCSRCAATAQLVARAEFDHHFVGKGQLDAGDPYETTSDFDADPDVTEHDGATIFLDDLCIEHLILALPDVPLCTENCLGVCPQCGINRNNETCTMPQNCYTSAADSAQQSPWTALAGFEIAQQGKN